MDMIIDTLLLHIKNMIGKTRGKTLTYKHIRTKVKSKEKKKLTL